MKLSTAIDGVLSNAAAPAMVREDKVTRDFNELLAANEPALARLAGSYTNSGSERDDLLQEIALAVWQALPRFRGECSERTFLFRVAHNRAVAHLARRRPRGAEIADGIEVPDPALNPEAGLAQEQRAQNLQRAIRQLPVIYRQAITLALEELSYVEIAEVLGVSESNVGARLSRARQLLRQLLESNK